MGLAVKFACAYFVFNHAIHRYAFKKITNASVTLEMLCRTVYSSIERWKILTKKYRFLSIKINKWTLEAIQFFADNFCLEIDNSNWIVSTSTTRSSCADFSRCFRFNWDRFKFNENRLRQTRFNQFTSRISSSHTRFDHVRALISHIAIEHIIRYARAAGQLISFRPQ